MVILLSDLAVLNKKNNMNSIWQWMILENSLKDWFIAFGIIAIASVMFRVLRGVMIKKLQAMAERTSSTFDDFAVAVLKKSVMPFLYVLAFYVGVSYLSFSAGVEKVVHVAMLSIATWFVIRIITAIIGYFFQRYSANGATSTSQQKQAKGILLLVKIVLWIGGIIFLVDNLGYNITTIVTGLGIGGIAIALAAQAVLADLFSYLVIFFDKPFETGDFITLGDKAGVVEYIGIKTTRLRTLSGEQLILSNTDLTNSRVHNFKRMEKRRVVFSVGVTYETSAQQVRQIPSIIKEIINDLEGVQFDRAHFGAFGDFSLNFEVVFYMLTADYNTYMDIRQQVFIRLFERFEEEGIEFAYPTQKLLVSAAAVPQHD
jgi:small-conductance mechanosensitive channel